MNKSKIEWCDMTIDHLEFSPKDADDPDEKTLLKFNFEMRGMQFFSWKIRSKDGIHCIICPPYIKRMGERTNIVKFVDNEDFRELTRIVVHAAYEIGLLGRKGILKTSHRKL